MGNFDYTKYIVDIPDFPIRGIIFKDVMPVFGDAEAFAHLVDDIAEHFANKGITKIVGPDARGFILGAAVAYKLGVGFVPARKAGKLPREVYSEEYTDEYATNCMEIHTDSLTPEDRVLIVDDLVATAGTAVACSHLVKKAGAKTCGYAFLLELLFYEPEKKLHTEDPDAEYFTLVQVEGE